MIALVVAQTGDRRALSSMLWPDAVIIAKRRSDAMSCDTASRKYLDIAFS